VAVRSESGPGENENDMALQWAEMGMARWIFGVKVTGRFLYC